MIFFLFFDPKIKTATGDKQKAQTEEERRKFVRITITQFEATADQSTSIIISRVGLSTERRRKCLSFGCLFTTNNTQIGSHDLPIIECCLCHTLLSARKRNSEQLPLNFIDIFICDWRRLANRSRLIPRPISPGSSPSDLQHVWLLNFFTHHKPEAPRVSLVTRDEVSKVIEYAHWPVLFLFRLTTHVTISRYATITEDARYENTLFEQPVLSLSVTTTTTSTSKVKLKASSKKTANQKPDQKFIHYHSNQDSLVSFYLPDWLARLTNHQSDHTHLLHFCMSNRRKRPPQT